MDTSDLRYKKEISMKRNGIILLALIYSIKLMGLEISAPDEILLDPSCSDWSYSECSIEVSGHLYYRFNIGFTEGDFPANSISMLLDYDNCTNWTYYTNQWGQECYSKGSGSTGQVGLEIDLEDYAQIPGDHQIIQLVILAANYVDGPYVVSESVEIDVRVKEPTLSGNWPICYNGSKTFTLSGYPTSDIDYMDFEISSNLYEISSTSNSITVRAKTSSTSGEGWIKPKYYMDCSEWRECPKTDVFVGKFQSIFVEGTPDVCPNSLYVYEAEVPLGHKSSYTYSWEYPSGWYKYSQWTNHLHLQTPILPGNMTYGTVRVDINNGCGPSGLSGITVYPSYSCGGYYMASPNPAVIYTEIDITSENAKALETSYDSNITLTVVDKMGSPVMKVNVESLPYKLNTGILQNGEYIIQIISQPKDQAPLIDSIKLVVSK